MRLLYITTKISGAGGMQRVLAVKTDFLISNKDYEVHILTTNTEDEEEVFYDFNKQVIFHTITPNKKGLSYFWSYKKLLRDSIANIKPDIVIMLDNGLKSFLLPFILKKKYPLVYELHVSKQIITHLAVKAKYSSDKLVFSLMAMAASRFDKFVVLTPKGEQEWHHNNVQVIPNPLWFIPYKRSNPDSKIAVAVGRHVYEKGYDRMFEIWRNVTTKYPEWQLHIYGETDAGLDLTNLAEKMEVVNNVKFLKPTKNVIEAYQKASLYLMTSRYEGFGMVLLEAMACGLPCLAFDCPVGPSGIITENYNGFLIKDGDITAYTDALMALIENKDLRIKMSENAVMSSQEFTTPAIMEQWDKLFKTLRT